MAGNFGLTKAFINRICNERLVDTRFYRYAVHECYNAEECWGEIRRLPLDALDTTAALSGWETVAILT